MTREYVYLHVSWSVRGWHCVRARGNGLGLGRFRFVLGLVLNGASPASCGFGLAGLLGRGPHVVLLAWPGGWLSLAWAGRGDPGWIQSAEIGRILLELNAHCRNQTRLL